MPRYKGSKGGSYQVFLTKESSEYKIQLSYAFDVSPSKRTTDEFVLVANFNDEKFSRKYDHLIQKDDYFGFIDVIAEKVGDRKVYRYLIEDKYVLFPYTDENKNSRRDFVTL